MSYNLLLSTNLNKPNLKHWKLTNCELINGFLSSKDCIYSIEQEVIVSKPTKFYFSVDYVCFDPNVKSIYCGIISNSGELKAIKKKVQIKKRKKLSIVSAVESEKIKIIVIIESKTPISRFYIDSPLLVDLNRVNKPNWPKYCLDKYLDYRYGYDYTNEYSTGEIKIDSHDFISPYTKTEKGITGIIATVEENDWFKISCKYKENSLYLAKLDYENINDYGNIYFSYGEINSIDIDERQLYVLFRAVPGKELKLYLKNSERLPYQVNLKHIMIVDVTNLNLGEEDIPYLPFV